MIFKRWCIRWGRDDSISVSETYSRPCDAMDAFAKQIYEADRLREIALELKIQKSDLVFAIWRQAKREGRSLQRVEIKEV